MTPQNNAIVPQESGNNQIVSHKEFDERAVIEFMDAMGLATKLNDQEKKQFLQISKAYGLNPFKREIHVSKYGDNFAVIIGYEEFIKRAERSGQLDGWEVVTEGEVNKEDYTKSTLKAIFTCHRKDRKFPFRWEVDYTEYVQTATKYDSNKKPIGKRPNAFWDGKPKHMIKKVAAAQGFRLCFSDELGGMPFTEEELTLDVNHEEVSSGKMPPLTKAQKEQLATEGDATKAVNDDITSEQKERIKTLLSNKLISEEERSKALANIETYTTTRAQSTINGLELEIKKREQLQENFKKQNTTDGE